MATLLIAPTGVWRKRDLIVCWFGDFGGAQTNLTKKNQLYNYHGFFHSFYSR